MTALMRNLPAVDDGLTLDDIDDMPHSVRAELHNGDLLSKLPGTFWHEKITEAIAAWFERHGWLASTNPGLKRTKRDTRIP